MEVKRCFICMYQGLIRVGTNNDVIYHGSEERRIQLCYSHSVELYKHGQFKFITKYRENFADSEIDTATFSTGGSGKRSIWY